MKLDFTKPILLDTSRAWRTYLGGKTISRLHGEEGEDCHFPEEWLMSLVVARNAGRKMLVQRGNQGSHDRACVLLRAQNGHARNLRLRNQLGEYRVARGEQHGNGKRLDKGHKCLPTFLGGELDQIFMLGVADDLDSVTLKNAVKAGKRKTGARDLGSAHQYRVVILGYVYPFKGKFLFQLRKGNGINLVHSNLHAVVRRKQTLRALPLIL